MSDWFDVMHPAEKYEKDGQEKTRWVKVGSLRTVDGVPKSIKLDAFPAQGDGWLQIFSQNKGDNSQPRPGSHATPPPGVPDGYEGVSPDDFDDDIPF